MSVTEKKKILKAKHFEALFCYGEWEMKRGQFRVGVRNDKLNCWDNYMISGDEIVKALKLAGLKFEVEKKRVYEHLKVMGAGDE